MLKHLIEAIEFAEQHPSSNGAFSGSLSLVTWKRERRHSNSKEGEPLVEVIHWTRKIPCKKAKVFIKTTSKRGTGTSQKIAKDIKAKGLELPLAIIEAEQSLLPSSDGNLQWYWFSPTGRWKHSNRITNRRTFVSHEPLDGVINLILATHISSVQTTPVNVNSLGDFTHWSEVDWGICNYHVWNQGHLKTKASPSLQYWIQGKQQHERCIHPLSPPVWPLLERLVRRARRESYRWTCQKSHRGRHMSHHLKEVRPHRDRRTLGLQGNHREQYLWAVIWSPYGGKTSIHTTTVKQVTVIEKIDNTPLVEYTEVDFVWNDLVFCGLLMNMPKNHPSLLYRLGRIHPPPGCSWHFWRWVPQLLQHNDSDVRRCFRHPPSD